VLLRFFSLMFRFLPAMTHGRGTRLRAA